MRSRAWRWLVLAVPVFAACAQVIGADFNDLVPDNGTAGTAGAGGSTQPGGASGSAGDATPVDSGGKGGTGGASGGAAGASGGAAGASGNVISDASVDTTGAGGAEPPDATADVGPDHQKDADGADAVMAGTVVINEIKGIGAGDDWIELHNPGQAAIALDGFSLTQATGATGPPDMNALLKFPTPTTLNAGGFLMVLAQQTMQGGPVTSCAGIAPSCFTVTWGISSATGERLYLLTPNGMILQQVDYLAPGSGGPNNGETYARAANGTYQVSSPTPNQPNGI